MGKDRRKPIVELDVDGKIIAFWESAKNASDYYQNITVVSISYNVTGVTRQAKGHYFRFATPLEIKTYRDVQGLIKEPIAEEKPIQNLEIPELPVETIPNVIQKNENQVDVISPYDRLLQKSKKKFNNNSE